ncbi:hypothetical protein BY458DRAFT_583619 [Sporodiniella umbellata]|nr:hypothetical protein BY458DRAFT_583619 [Sporodiniella umbellata]
MKLCLLYILLILVSIELVPTQRTPTGTNGTTQGQVNQVSTTSNQPTPIDPPTPTTPAPTGSPSTTEEPGETTSHSTSNDGSSSSSMTSNSNSESNHITSSPVTTHKRKSSSQSIEPTFSSDTGEFPNQNTEEHQTGIIVGSVVGGVAGIALLVGLFFWFSRRIGCMGRQNEPKAYVNNHGDEDLFQPARRFVPPSTSYIESYRPNEYPMKPHETEYKPNT